MVSDGCARARRAVGAFACAVSIAALASCAAVTPRTRAPVAADAPFAADGRLSARHGNDAVSATFHWTHAPPRDDIELATPLGQTVAKLTGDAARGQVAVQLADGRTLTGRTWTDITSRALGFALPVSGLSSWMRGGAQHAGVQAAETDAAGRLTLLREDGWEIVLDYADASARVPARMRLSYPDVEVRIAIDRLVDIVQ